MARLLVGIVWLTTIPTASFAGQLRPDPEDLAHASPELLDQLRTDAFAYFRFINRPWIARVCESFAADVSSLPSVRLHGDAHIEQFAVTNDAWGLDDFDDAARGPAVIDIVRFMGSIDLAARQRGWTSERDALFDRFFEGYRRGLSDPDYQPPQPDIVSYVRAQTPVTREGFLAWGQSKMDPMDDASMKAVTAGMAEFARLVQRTRPDLAPDFFIISRAGWLHMGVGSATSVKILLRVRGPSADARDDELLEARELTLLGGHSCVEDTTFPPTLRIIDAAKQLGRLRHTILASGPDLAIPELMVRGRQLHDWWIRSWEPSYRELRIDDLRSADDLSAVVYDAGAQLGAGCLHDHPGAPGDYPRKQILGSIAALEGRLRQETTALVDELMRAWRELGKQ